MRKRKGWRRVCDLSKGLTALDDHAILASAPQMRPCQDALWARVCQLWAPLSLAHPSELSLLRGNAPLAPASPHTPTWHFCYRLSCSSERRFLPHPTHIHSGCLKFCYLFPLPRAGPTKEEREIEKCGASSVLTSVLKLNPESSMSPETRSKKVSD